MKRVIITTVGAAGSGAVAIRVGYVPGAGRGVFAARDIAVGDLIHTADPVVAHPSLASMHKACYYCVRGIKQRMKNTGRLEPITMPETSANMARTWQHETGHGSIFCSASCEDSAAKVFYSLEKQADWSQLHAYCSTHGLRFPLVAKRLACMVASSATSEHTLDILTHVNLSQGIPDEMSRMETICWQQRWHRSLATASSVPQFTYCLPYPNVNILWPNNVTANLVARQDITAGEELRITYIDANMPCNARRSLLQQAYGFVCECVRCKEGD